MALMFLHVYQAQATDLAASCPLGYIVPLNRVSVNDVVTVYRSEHPCHTAYSVKA